MHSRDVIRCLRAAGFEEVGKRGSHLKLRHPDGRMAIVPDPKKDLPLGTLCSIERQSGVPLRAATDNKR
ncbi:type II toxin-antitoxin system HicA family toxin [Nitratidesulfovibrio sp. SRB-5]|uniref:type II toxin-antitoxin system HicA family toxin n=1 Tax=Nitratidesulfovibrio sp. SRB-5 TaxID=2872636 RepID=UPI0010265AE9|nr:type II toxin-antitoxin system HicA family toxin [Nitratidesulfovibrio sp. SRB-5]MBZ2172115.1 type II toxin-antitoxin system HicA family toxin [Nitratidesulfovibrio sp. SRB-5]RXF77075.1 addiction module toxin, HicA family [Desulfovibrio sp. DS-1]